MTQRCKVVERAAVHLLAHVPSIWAKRAQRVAPLGDGLSLQALLLAGKSCNLPANLHPHPHPCATRASGWVLGGGGGDSADILALTPGRLRSAPQVASCRTCLLSSLGVASTKQRRNTGPKPNTLFTYAKTEFLIIVHARDAKQHYQIETAAAAAEM